MNAFAGRRPANAAGHAQRRQLILLAGLSLVLVLLLVWQVPKLLGRSDSSGAAAPAASAPVTPAATVAPAPAAATATGPAARRTERWVKRQPARDPFAPLGVGSAPAAPAATPAAPAIRPTAAVMWTNGHRQVVGVGEEFRVGDTTLRLVSVARDAVRVAPVVGGLAGGKARLTVTRAKALTLENAITGVRYRIGYSLALSAVPPAGS